MSETEAQPPTTQPVVEDDPTKVSKSPKKDLTRVTKKERTPAQLANDQRFAQLARERKEKKIVEREEDKRNKAKGTIGAPREDTPHQITLLFGLGGAIVITLVVVVWFLFFRKGKKGEEKVVEEEKRGYDSE